MAAAPDRLDRRIVPESLIELLRACRKTAPCHLGGGAALSGAYLRHRLTGDLDLFVHDRDEMRDLVRQLPAIASGCGANLSIHRDAGQLVRSTLRTAQTTVELDVVHEPVADIEPTVEVEGVTVESLADLRANKLTCLLSRSEPRDLVDLFFLDRAGFPAEADLELALAKDPGIDPGVLAWLLREFPTEPLPQMLQELSPSELRRFRDELAARFRDLVVGSE
jgi:hypothetical protein